MNATSMNTSRFESLTGETDLDFPAYGMPPAEPMQLVRDWLAEATARGVREPLSLALATADEHGRASNRIITISGVSDRGLVFASHNSSRKGRELAATGWASGVLYWRETGQQLIVSGPVEQLSDAESDTLWAARPAPMHAMTSASRQSEPLHDVAALRARARRLAEAGGPLHRPARFVAYLLEPAEIEFWCADSDRLHRRLRYTRNGRGWCTTRLQP